jgi:uncharacterized protein YjbI with pentapeptide repeats
MRQIARRTFLGLTLAATSNTRSALPNPAVSQRHKRRVSQSELDDTIALHSLWLDSAEQGARAVFAGQDLSGLIFRSFETRVVNLRGADFTEADLSGIQGDEVSFHRASLQGARLTSSFLTAPIFSGATLRRAECKNLVWGPDPKSHLHSADAFDPLLACATLIETDLSLVCFDGSVIRGYFSGATFLGASLRRATFDHSIFGGVEIYYQNSFSEALLREVGFRHASITATRFRFSKLEQG